MATGSGGSCKELHANIRSYTWYFIAATCDEVLYSTEMKDRFIEMLRSHEDYRMVFLPSVKIVIFATASSDAASQASIEGFIHGGNK
jgi:hypothetical protein